MPAHLDRLGVDRALDLPLGPDDQRLGRDIADDFAQDLDRAGRAEVAREADVGGKNGATARHIGAGRARATCRFRRVLVFIRVSFGRRAARAGSTADRGRTAARGQARMRIRGIAWAADRCRKRA